MPKWCLIQIADANSTSKAGQLIGRKVILKYGKNNFIGKIVGLHGKKGVVKAKFHKGVPGRAIGATVVISPKRSTTLYSQAKTSTPKRSEDKRKKRGEIGRRPR
jgi:large subunit ribosomal protein L35Ae